MGNTNFLKIIYFDETFVADYMQIIAGGELKKTTEFVTEASSEFSGHAGAGVGINTEIKGLPKLFKFLSGVSLKAETEGEIDLSRTKEKIARNILENTLLADFVALLEADKKRSKNKRCSGIKIFPNVTMYPEVNSFSYLMLIAPFLQMMDGRIPIASNDGTEYHLDLSKMEDAINKGRGYYEFVAKIDGVEKIFRFNLEAFRNNYTMSDLPKMQLTYYGIKVGQIDKSDLRVEKEFEFGTGKAAKRADYTGITSQIEGSSKIDVYDVVLAGVIENNEQD